MSKFFVALLFSVVAVPAVASANSDDYGFPIKESASTVSMSSPVSNCFPVIYSTSGVPFGSRGNGLFTVRQLSQGFVR
jgi:hypothetical protein